MHRYEVNQLIYEVDVHIEMTIVIAVYHTGGFGQCDIIGAVEREKYGKEELDQVIWE